MSAEKMPRPPGVDPAVRRIAVVLIVGALAAVFDSTIMSVALHTLATEMHGPIATIQWVTTGYVLALAAAVPLSGWVQNVFGNKGGWMLALAIFLLGSLLCSAAWNAESLIAFRVVQGIGGGIILPLMMSIVMQAAGGQKLGRLSAAIGLPAVLGPILGPAIGGIIVNWLDWRWIFLVNVPFCVVGLWLAQRFLVREPQSARVQLDIVGVLLLVPALTALLWGLSNASGVHGFAAPHAWALVVAGVILLFAFVLYARRRPGRALVDVRLLAKRAVWSSSALLFLSGLAVFGIMLLLPLYLQDVREFNVLAAGLFMIPQGVGTFLVRPLAGRLVDTVGPRAVALAGFAVVGVATIPFALSDATTNEWILGAVLLVRGVGLGGIVMPLMVAPMQALAKPEIPHVSIITRTAQQVGGSFGTAVLAVLLQRAFAAHRSAGVEGITTSYDQAFWWSAGFAGAGVLLCLFLPGTRGADRGGAPSPQPSGESAHRASPSPSRDMP